MEIKTNISLSPYTTFKVGGPAKFFALAKTIEDWRSALDFARDKKLPIFILGGGSNVIINDNGFDGLVIKNEISGIKIVKETKSSVWVEAAAGETWSALVNYCVTHNYYGLENLFLIPGTVGAAPVQNIGAYGVEFKDTCHSVRVMSLEDGNLHELSASECDFAYRDSIFKGRAKGKYAVIGVVMKLSKQPRWFLEYGNIKDKLLEKGISTPNARQLVEVIMEIRNSKLPNPAIISNAGSFFKNPEISEADFGKLNQLFPEIKSFPGSRQGLIKIAAGWLIEQAGFKGKTFGHVGTYENQALIIVNHGGASAQEIIDFSETIVKAVRDKFGIILEREVNFIE